MPRALHNQEIHFPILAVTLGEPAGIGPDIFLKLSQFPQAAHLIVFADPGLILERAKLLNLNIKTNIIEHLGDHIAQIRSQSPAGSTQINIIPILLNNIVEPGVLSVKNSAYVLEALKQATDACLAQHCDAMVTGPVHKAILRQYDKIFIDQTHLISAQCQVDYQQVMMGFVSEGMRLALATLHEPIHALSNLITPELINQKINCFAQHLSDYFQIKHPKIGILGLNPHAGENGLIGLEEKEILLPCLEKLRQNNPGYHLSDLLSPDSAFISSHRKQYDGFLAWYHDQGLGPFKTLYEQKAATLLFGLPIIRASVDHGTALSLAGTHDADPSSFQYAIELATQIVNNLS